MRALKRRDTATYNEVQRLFDVIELSPDLGYELGGEWDGCMAVHCGRDRYRVIWEMLDPETDHSGTADEVVPVVILRVGPKTDSQGRSIYDQRRP